MVCFAGAGGMAERMCPGGQVSELATALARGGHEVVVYTRRDGGAATPVVAGVRTVPFEVGSPTELAEPEVMPFAGALADRLRDGWGQSRPDVVHTHGWLSGLAGLLAGDGDRPPLVHSFDRVPWPLSSTRRRQVSKAWVSHFRMRRAIARRAGRLIVGSHDEQSGLLRMGIPRGRVSLVPPGVNCDRLGPRGAREPCTSKYRLVQLGFPRDAGTAIRALSALPDTELVIVPDSGEACPQKSARDMHTLATRLRVQERVRLATQEEQDEPGRRAALIRSANAVLCLSPPRQPVTGALEAMAYAVPVIAYNSADPIDAVIDRVTGLHVDSGDPKALALAARELLDNTAERQGMGFAGRDRAVLRYSWPPIAAETGRVYQRMVGPSAPRS